MVYWITNEVEELANTLISTAEAGTLQENLVRKHATNARIPFAE